MPEAAETKLTEKQQREQQIKAAKERRAKRRRADIGTAEYRLNAPAREGFKRRWVNDTTGRIDRYHADGWDVVQEDGTDRRHVDTSKEGKQIDAVLMEIPDEFYEENQAEKLERIVDPTQMDEAQAHTNVDGMPDEYIPGGKSSAVQRKLR